MSHQDLSFTDGFNPAIKVKHSQNFTLPIDMSPMIHDLHNFRHQDQGNFHILHHHHIIISIEKMLSQKKGL